MNKSRRFYKIAEEIASEILSAMKENEVSRVNLATADELVNWDKIYTYRYDEYDRLEERPIIGLQRSEYEGEQWLDIISVTNDERSFFDTEEDVELDDYAGDADSLFGGNILGVFTAFNLAENLAHIKGLIKEQGGK